MKAKPESAIIHSQAKSETFHHAKPKSSLFGSPFTAGGKTSMMLSCAVGVFLTPGATDLRKSNNSLSVMVAAVLDLDPLSGHLFVFCHRQRNHIKVLYWDRNGFCLWQKRLEKHRFPWPANTQQVQEITSSELRLILDGLDIRVVKPYERLTFSCATTHDFRNPRETRKRTSSQSGRHAPQTSQTQKTSFAATSAP